MPRQNSRYFTPVIKKLLEAKQKENIMIDEEFKDRLRAQLISGSVEFEGKMQKPAADYSATGDFLRRWRYQLALVPALFLLALVAVQVFKMPVAIKSEVVVPRSQTAIAPTPETSVPETPKIKTFAGRTVLPPNYYLDKNREDSGNAGGDYPAIQFNLEKTIAEKQPAVAVKQEIEQVPAAEVSVKTVESAAPVLSAETGGMTGDLLYMTSGSPVSETTQKRQVIEPVPAETSEMLKPRASEPVLQEAQYNESLQPIAAETQQTFTGPQAFSLGAVRVNDTEEAIAPMLSIRPTQPEIYYSYDFSEEEKSDLENNLFPDVIDGRNILTVNITKGELDVTKLEIVYVGGTSEARLFKKNVETGNWDEVRYAQKYYYDNALSYTKLDLEPLHFYVPFQYSDEYYYGD